MITWLQTMRGILFFTLFLPITISTFGQIGVSLEPVEAYHQSALHDIKGDTVSKDFNSAETLSEGYTDSSFHFQLGIEVSNDLALLVNTDYPRSLQYSLSSVEGIILRKGRIFRSMTLDLSSLRPGSYALYIFSGQKIVRALMVDRQTTNM